MRFSTWTSVLGTLCSLAVAAPAVAQLETTAPPLPAPGPINWTATGGQTVGNNVGVVHVEAGWPGIGFTYLRGMDERTDVGLHVGFNYGFEGTANSVVGLNLAAPLRRKVAQSGNASFALRADPGLSIYGNKGAALVGIGGPVGVVAGFQMDPHLSVDLGADVPVLLSFANPTGLLIGPQIGGGAEYLLDRNLALTFRARVGPEFAIASGGSGVKPGFTTLFGLAYNVR